MQTRWRQSPGAPRHRRESSPPVCHLLNLRRDDGGSTSELVGRDRRIARGDLRRPSSHAVNELHLRPLRVPEIVARKLRAKMRSDILLRRSPLFLSLELGIGT